MDRCSDPPLVNRRAVGTRKGLKRPALLKSRAIQQGDTRTWIIVLYQPNSACCVNFRIGLRRRKIQINGTEKSSTTKSWQLSNENYLMVGQWWLAGKWSTFGWQVVNLVRWSPATLLIGRLHTFSLESWSSSSSSGIRLCEACCCFWLLPRNYYQAKLWWNNKW